jgi:hypothetical protein
VGGIQKRSPRSAFKLDRFCTSVETNAEFDAALEKARKLPGSFLYRNSTRMRKTGSRDDAGATREVLSNRAAEKLRVAAAAS